MSHPMSRRVFLARGLSATAGVAALGAGSSLLAACGSSSKAAAGATTTATSAPAAASTTSVPVSNVGTVSFQLSWLKTVDFAGSYIADTHGYYAKNGVAVNLVAGGPTVAIEPVVTSGKALIGRDSMTSVATAVNQGAALSIVGAVYQKNPFCILSLASKPITSPEGLYGKKIGVSPGDSGDWKAFLALSHLDASKIDTLPAGFDPTPLVNGTFDGFMSYSTDEPNQLKAKGVATHVLLFEDYGYHLISEVYVVRTASLQGSDRAKLLAFLRGEILGWQQQVADPTKGTLLTTNVYGKGTGLGYAEQLGEAVAQNSLIVSPDTTAHGLFYMSPTSIAKSVETLSLAGTKASASLCTNELLDEIYGGKTVLAA